MKTLLSILTFSLMSTQLVLAACPETPTSKAANSLRLSGRVSLIDKSLDGKPTGFVETDLAKRLSPKSEEFKFLQSKASERNSAIISGVFGLESEGSVMVIVQNKTSCDISILGTDGEDISSLNIVPDSIKSNSISFYRGEPAIVTITKMKKSKLLSN